MTNRTAVLVPRLRKRASAALALVVIALAFAPAAQAAAHIYWWQQNMAAGQVVSDYAFGAHNRTYNELYFGPGAYYRSEIWEVTQAGYAHFDKWCWGNCYYAHPGYFYDYPFCSNRDDSAHFVNRCMSEW